MKRICVQAQFLFCYYRVTQFQCGRQNEVTRKCIPVEKVWTHMWLYVSILSRRSCSQTSGMTWLTCYMLPYSFFWLFEIKWGVLTKLWRYISEYLGLPRFFSHRLLLFLLEKWAHITHSKIYINCLTLVIDAEIGGRKERKRASSRIWVLKWLNDYIKSENDLFQPYADTWVA